MNNLAVDLEAINTPYGLSDSEIEHSPTTVAHEEFDYRDHNWVVSHQIPRKSHLVKITIDDKTPSRVDLFQRIVDRTNHLLNLPDNWDSYGAKKILPNIAISMINVLGELPQTYFPNPTIVPSSDGGLQIEWHQNNIDIEIDFLSDGKYILNFEDQSNEYEPIDDLEIDPNNELDQLINCINLLVTRSK